MSEELKVNIPFFNGSEEAEIENKLLFHLDEFTDEIMKTITKDKDIMILKKVIKQQQKEIKENQVLIDDIKDHRIVYIDTPEFEEKFISKDKIRELLEVERIKALDRFDNKLDVKQRIYKRNIQVALIDKLKKELLKEK